MTDNKLKISIKIPQSSPANDEAHYSIPDISKETAHPENLEKSPFDMQKISITLFVIFLSISSLVYLLFINETEPSLTATEQSTTTSERLFSRSNGREVEASIDNDLEYLSEPIPVEEEISEFSITQLVENEPLKVPLVTEEQEIIELQETIPEIEEPVVEVSETLINTLPGDQPQVVRAQLTSAILQREPVDVIDHFWLTQGTSEQIHFFMELSDLADQQVTVHWYFKDEEMATTTLNTGHPQWRTRANKLLTKTQLGPWHVELRDASGNLLAQRHFTVSNHP